MNANKSSRPGTADKHGFYGSALVYTIYRHGIRLPEAEAADRAKLADRQFAAGQAT